MIRLLSFVILALSLVTGHPSPVASTVTVHTRTGFGTGVVVRQTNDLCFVWTAGHLGGGKSSPPVVTVQQDGRRLKARLVRGDRERDLAVYWLRDKQLTSTRFNTQSDAKLGRAVINVSHGGVTNGSLGIRLVHEGQVYGSVLDAALLPGASGSGVFDRETGECVGIVLQSDKEFLALYCPADLVRQWAREQKIEWAFDPIVPVPVTFPKP